MSCFVEEAEPSHAELSASKRQKLKVDNLTEVQPAVSIL